MHALQWDLVWEAWSHAWPQVRAALSSHLITSHALSPPPPLALHVCMHVVRMHAQSPSLGKLSAGLCSFLLGKRTRACV